MNGSMMDMTDGMMMACMVAAALFALVITVVVIIQATLLAKILREIREAKGLGRERAP